jgi:hypothetical protein
MASERKMDGAGFKKIRLKLKLSAVPQAAKPDF